MRSGRTRCSLRICTIPLATAVSALAGEVGDAVGAIMLTRPSKATRAVARKIVRIELFLNGTRLRNHTSLAGAIARDAFTVPRRGALTNENYSSCFTI